MTVYMPEGLPTAGTGALFAAPAVAYPTRPNLTEMAAVGSFKLHCSVYGWAPTREQSKLVEERYCLAEGVESFGRVTNSVEAIEVVYNPQNPADTDYPAALYLAEGSTHYILDRRDIDSQTDLAAGQFGDMYKVRVGARSRLPITNADGETHRLRIELAVESVNLDSKMITAPAAWAATTSYTTGKYVTHTGGGLLECTTAGTSGATIPALPAAIGGTTGVDGVTTVWTRRG